VTSMDGCLAPLLLVLFEGLLLQPQPAHVASWLSSMLVMLHSTWEPLLASSRDLQQLAAVGLPGSAAAAVQSSAWLMQQR